MRQLRFALVALVLLLVMPTHALADGSASIAGAPTVVFGQQEFGNLGTYVAPPNYPGNCISWWALPLTAGDSVQILWEASPGDYLRLYSPKTTDFNYQAHGERLINSYLDEGITKSEATYEATETGPYPLDLIRAGEKGCGPYNFTVYVQHALVVALPHISTLRRSGTLAVAIHTPEGGVVTNPALEVLLQIKGRGAWVTLGHASVAGSVAAVRYSLPRRLRHQRATLRAIAQGPGYKPAVSTHAKVHTL